MGVVNATPISWNMKPSNGELIVFKFESNFNDTMYIITHYDSNNLQLYRNISKGWNDIYEINKFDRMTQGIFVHKDRLSYDYIKYLELINMDLYSD